MEIIQSIASATIAPLMGLLVWQIQRLIIKKEKDSQALKLLLRVIMEEKHEKYINVQRIDADDLAGFRELYEAYHSLGGNGRGTVWMEDLEKLERSE